MHAMEMKVLRKIMDKIKRDINQSENIRTSTMICLYQNEQEIEEKTRMITQTSFRIKG